MPQNETARVAADIPPELLEVSLALSSTLPLPAVLQRVVDVAVRVTAARYGALGVLAPEGGRLSDFITSGLSDAERATIGALPVGRGVLGVLIDEARPLRLGDLSEDPRSVGFPANHPVMHSFLGAPVIARGQVFGNLYLTEKIGASAFSERDEQALVLLAGQAGVVIENARLYEETEERARRLEALREVTIEILSGADLDEVLGLVARRARALADADVAAIALPEGRSGFLRLRVADGANADGLRGMEVPLASSVSGEVLRSGQTIVLADAHTDERIYQPMVTGAGPWMFVPLRASAEPFGTLAVGREQGRDAFDQHAAELIEGFADQAALAFEYARTQQEVQRLAVIGDRERIAKELHDGVIQALFGVGMSLQATVSLSGDPDLAERIDGAISELDRVIRDLRNYIFGLRPGILADRSLERALGDMAKEFEERSGVTAVVDVDAAVAAELAPRAPDIVQLVREALSNIARHANALTCRISVRRDHDHAVVEVEDDGRGFDQKTVLHGLGLGNLRERVEQLAGTLELSSAPGTGTLVRLTIPLQ